MQVSATAKFVRLSPRKARLLLATVKGMPAQEAVLQLKHRPQVAAKPLAKLIASATANAEHNFSLDPAMLVIEKLTADAGPTLKRFKPVSRGRAQNIRRPTAHLTVVLKDVSGGGADRRADATAASKRPRRRPASAAKASAKADRSAADSKSKNTTEPKPKVSSKAGNVHDVKHEHRSDSRTEVKQVAPRKSDRQTGRGRGDK